ncbi:MAG: DEAD/DEAH box helicase, partial [Candidatus Heimdallarchaeota archaeon]|nr:DEAD/DEAH box helicase [Candidatus Heimdallarchaeota archaeon]
QLSANKKLSIISVYGGVSISTQIRDLTRADVVVATPGRLLDHLNRKTINTKKIKILVMDEADRMFDMGFIDDVEKIIRECPPKRQTLFFSATISPRVNTLADKHMVKPVSVSAESHVDPKKLKQVYYDVSRNMKLSLLVHLLQNEDSMLVMIFCNTRKSTDFVVKNLRVSKLNAMGIHGGMTQSKRSKTIKMFSRADKSVLVCTDVAARGIHVDNVSHIYNYEIPKDAVDYVHRIGRTARAGGSGEVVNILCDYDYDNFSKILSGYRDFSIKEVGIPQLNKIQSVRAENAGKPQRRRAPIREYKRRR